VQFLAEIQAFLVTLNWRDVLDIAIITLLLYQGMQMVRGTRVLSILSGFACMAALYYLSRTLGLYTLTWFLQHVFSSLFLVLVIIFQKDIRQWLTDMGSHGLWRRQSLNEESVEELVKACVEMAYMRVGALIVLQRAVPLKDMTEREGVKVDARISRRLLLNIFYPKAPLHDGAVVINNWRITSAACILPLAEVHGQNFGTRHRAALGATLESDAVVVVVSEERGEISVALKGELTRNLDATTLRKVLHDAFK
jgi:diadenylate cyclase